MRKLVVIFCAFCFLLVLNQSNLYGQANWWTDLETETVLTSPGDQPFWFHSNKFGLYDSESMNFLQSIALHREIQDDKVFDIGFGVDAIGRASNNSKLFMNELYGEVKWGPLELYVGKKEWQDGIWNSDLSMGSMIWSGNAATMPKIMLRIPEYLDIPYTKGFVALRGYYGHGWFGSDRYVEGTYLHEKALYLRFLPDAFPVNGHVGLIHNVQWGGEHPRLGKLPDGLNDYFRIVTGRAGESGTSPGGEVLNALGNTVGAYEARLDVNLEQIDIEMYRQFYIETSVSTRLRSPWDGLWGLNVDVEKMTNGWVNTFLWEHLNTKKQNAKDGETIGADQYYHNFIYRNGWSYKERLIGSPLVSLGTVNGRLEVINNIILAHHLGIEGNIPVQIGQSNINYQLKATYSRNYGRTSNCSGDFCDEGDVQPLRTERMDQWYYQFRLQALLEERWSLRVALGLDSGDLSDRLGAKLGVRYHLE